METDRLIYNGRDGTLRAKKGAIEYNGKEDEIRCPVCRHFCASIRPALMDDQSITIICKKCKNKSIISK